MNDSQRFWVCPQLWWLKIVVKVGGDMLGHFPNSHFLQAGFCLLSTPEVTSIALSRKLTIFSQRSSGLACLLLEPFCSPESRISMFLPHNHCLHWLIFFFFFFWSSPPPPPVPCHWPCWRHCRTPCRSPRWLGRWSPPAAPSGCWWHSCSLLWWTSKSCTHAMPGPWLGRAKHHCPHPATGAATALWLLLFIFKFLVFPEVENPVLFSPSPCPPWEVCHSTLGHYHLPFV